MFKTVIESLGDYKVELDQVDTWRSTDKEYWVLEVKDRAGTFTKEVLSRLFRYGFKMDIRMSNTIEITMERGITESVLQAFREIKGEIISANSDIVSIKNQYSDLSTKEREKLLNIMLGEIYSLRK